MRFNIRIILPALLAAAFTLAACSSDDDGTPSTPSGPQPTRVAKTLFMYLPWTQTLTSELQRNVLDMQQAIETHGLGNTRVIVFLTTAVNSSTLFELVLKDGHCLRDTIATYTDQPYTTSARLASLFATVQSVAPAERYAMTIGGHGAAWLAPGVLPSSRVVQYADAKDSQMDGEDDYIVEKYGDMADAKSHSAAYDADDDWRRTRWFGGAMKAHQTSITSLAGGIELAGWDLDFILFDNCYMASVEVVYQLRHCARYIIGCPTEIFAVGMPYARIGGQLMGETDFNAVCSEFYDYYSSYNAPCGQISVSDCSQIDSLAAVMRKINATCVFDPELTSTLQAYDGYSATLFYDLGDYVAKLCPDADLLAEFNAQLARAVPYKATTPTYHYYVNSSNQGERDIEVYSGLNTSAPSSAPAAADWSFTDWALATE